MATLELDVRDYDSIQRMARRRARRLGKIDILVNNAGCNVRKRAVDVTWDDWNLVLDTNLRGTFFVTQAIARYMIEARYGRIITLGSETSVVPVLSMLLASPISLPMGPRLLGGQVSAFWAGQMVSRLGLTAGPAGLTRSAAGHLLAQSMTPTWLDLNYPN